MIGCVERSRPGPKLHGEERRKNDHLGWKKKWRRFSLKELCYAICYLFYNVSSHQWTFENNGPVWLFKIILRHGNWFLFSVARDSKVDMDWNLKELSRRFQVLCHACKNHYGYCSLMEFVWYPLYSSTVAFCVWVSVMTLEQNWPTTAISLRYGPFKLVERFCEDATFGIIGHQRYKFKPFKFSSKDCYNRIGIEMLHRLLQYLQSVAAPQ